jgi:hypothetical protein
MRLDFAMAASAMGLLHQLLEQEDPHYVFAMVIRQFRLLVLLRRALGSRRASALLARLPRFVLAKVTSQARNFRLEDLESVYHRLLETDLADKTSQIDLAIGLETLVAEWTRRDPARPRPAPAIRLPVPRSRSGARGRPGSPGPPCRRSGAASSVPNLR